MKSLAERVADPSFTPGRRDIDPLLDLLVADRSAAAVRRALCRRADLAGAAAIDRVARVAPGTAGPLVRLLGQLAGAPGADRPAIAAALIGLLDGDDPGLRRRAAVALGKLAGGEPGVEAALLGRLAAGDRDDVERAVIEALGIVGGEAALAALDGAEAGRPGLAEVIAAARMRLRRTATRPEAAAGSAIDAGARLPGRVRVWLHCRAGLEEMLAGEIGEQEQETGDRRPATGDRRWGRVRLVGKGMVEAELEGEIGAVFGARLWSEVGFPVSGDAVAALTSAEAAAILGALNPGEVRYRIRFAGGGHRRAAVRAIATAVAAARPELVNDPTRSDWEAVIGDGVVELRPRGLADPRFAYRRADVPAASHPTLAAALARAAFLAAEAPADEVIWDPFCGSGVELVERARLGGFRRLVGSDTSAAAIEAARANLSAAAVTAELVVADALHHRVDGLTTIVTNPPMGRRVARGDSAALLNRFVARAGELLPAGGRMVWIAPSPRRIAAALAAAGFAVRSRATVDMGGFPGELQVLERRRPG